MNANGSISMLLRTVLSGGVALGAMLCAMSPAGAEVGVTAAVNVDARGKPPGSAFRVLTLGTNIVHNEQVTTDGKGLVQILLLDGTTFTVGPNSNLTIDEFVYNPETGDAKVVASLTKGVFRFVGARTSQTEGGATVKTPVGTIGIRGAVSNISYNPATGETTAALVAGKSLNITDSDGTTRIVYETGYTAVITKGEGGGTTTTVRKSTPAETRVFQQQLSSKPGQNGGAGSPPTDEMADEVGKSNSDLPETVLIPPQKPVQSSGQQLEQQTTNDATKDDLDNEIDEQLAEDVSNARVLMAPDVYNAWFGLSFANAGGRGLVGSTPQTDQTLILSPQDGRLVSANGDIDLPDYSGTEGDEGLEQIYVGLDYGFCYPDVCDSASFQGNPLSGKAYAGAGDFAAYFLDMDDDDFERDKPFYVIYGTPTPEPALISMESGLDVRRYTLTDDPIQGIPVPFFNNDLYGGWFDPGTYNSSDMFVIEPGNSETADIRTFQSWVSIEGTGASQKSAAFLNTSNGFRNEDGDLILDGGRRGSFRTGAADGATNMRGGISTVPGGSGGHFFGPNAENFVIGTSIDPADTFFDSHNGGYDPEAEGYAGDGNFATHHVGDLVEETPLTEFSRTNGGSDGELQGFMAGMGESNFEGPENPYRLSGDGNGPNLLISFNAVDNAFAAQGNVYDNNEDNDVVKSMLLTFGHNGETFGQSAYVDDTYYGAMNNESPANNQLVNDSDQPVGQTPGQSAGNYIVSGPANPIEGYQHLVSDNMDCSDCAFIQWGWWGTRLSTGPEDESRQDYVHMGTWVAGEVSTDEEIDDMPFSGEVYYQGTAMGSVSRTTDDGVATYIAKGDLFMGYNFESRTGGVDISNFDSSEEMPGGVYLHADVAENSSIQSNLFSGALTGDNLYTSEDTDDILSGSLQGAFVNNPNAVLGAPNVAAGIIGDFSFGGTGVSAVGTIAGVQFTPQ